MIVNTLLRIISLKDTYSGAYTFEVLQEEKIVYRSDESFFTRYEAEVEALKKLKLLGKKNWSMQYVEQ